MAVNYGLDYDRLTALNWALRAVERQVRQLRVKPRTSLNPNSGLARPLQDCDCGNAKLLWQQAWRLVRQHGHYGEESDVTTMQVCSKARDVCQRAVRCYRSRSLPKAVSDPDIQLQITAKALGMRYSPQVGMDGSVVYVLQCGAE
jgi:hypothetical protein